MGGGSRIFLIVLALMPIVLALIPNPSVYTLLAPVCFYVLAYFMGRNYTTNNTTLKKAIISFGIIALSFGIRFGMKVLADGTILYERIIVTYTDYIAAFAILTLTAFIFKNIKASKGCKAFCNISFEIYLCHYMFVVGPASLMHLTSSFVVNILIVTLVSCGVAWILNRISKVIQKRVQF